MTAPILSVIVPNYKTPELTKICFRLLRKYTDTGKIRVIAIDNASGDASTEYLRKLTWIDLIERKVPEGEPGVLMHANALDEAFALVTTPYVMIMHTDTFCLHPDWLDYILGHFDSDKTAGVGSWKLEPPRSLLWRTGHLLEEMFRRLFRKKTRQEIKYLRGHCAVYRTDLVRKYTNGFYDGDSAGRAMHIKLEAAGFNMVFLPSQELGKFICHLNHATMILNPGAKDRKTGKASAGIRLGKKMQVFQDVLEADDLDL